MLTLSANIRVSTTIKKYPCFKKPCYVSITIIIINNIIIVLLLIMQLIQEMCHGFGIRFSSPDETREKIRSIQERWNSSLSPALVKFATESGRHQPESDELNGMNKILITYYFVIHFNLQLFQCIV